MHHFEPKTGFKKNTPKTLHLTCDVDISRHSVRHVKYLKNGDKPGTEKNWGHGSLVPTPHRPHEADLRVTPSNDSYCDEEDDGVTGEDTSDVDKTGAPTGNLTVTLQDPGSGPDVPVVEDVEVS